MMSLLENPILKLYVTLIVWVAVGFMLGRKLPKETPKKFGQLLYWVGVPISIIAFLRRADLSGWIWISPLTAWIAILVGAGLAWIWIDLGVTDERLKRLARGIELTTSGEIPVLADQRSALPTSSWSKSTQGSFLLAMMVGNTGYLGYPVILTLVGSENFAWALFYDLLGTTLGAYGLGVALAARFGIGQQKEKWFVKAMLKNPALWSMVFGLGFRALPLPSLAAQGLQSAAWGVVTLSLILIGMQLSQLPSLNKLQQALTCLGIKMLLTPLVVGTGLMFFGVTGAPRLVLVLQMAMPPAFATLVITEAYNLDRELTITALAFGYVGLLFTLPIWIWLFGGG
ncbi:MAG: AEC family transporter [Leptolyngbyaceae bacterium]|nr:AEC family transporter [Leptolyngbyaceae bacterium]